MGLDANEACAVDLSSISVTVPDAQILDNINWQLPRGQRAVILGPNGCGKSTLMRVITGYGHVTAGVAKILGETLGKTLVHELRKRLGIYDPSLVRLVEEGTTAEELVATGLFGHLTTYFDRPTREQLAVARATLNEVGMQGRTGQRFDTLSSGQQGRVWLARALVHVPELLILDEPTASFDILARETLLSSLVTLSKSRPQLSRIMVTHHLEEVLPDTDLVVLMSDGRIMAQGPPRDVLTSDMLSQTFHVPVTVHCDEGHWRWAVKR
ncbi:MAG: ATP-binding cassette domain-containing protein [Planctomycetales bacterium]|nr:ATP-binding cassette domain-containing protein [Planctomycetales bacterium]